MEAGTLRVLKNHLLGGQKGNESGVTGYDPNKQNKQKIKRKRIICWVWASEKYNAERSMGKEKRNSEDILNLRVTLLKKNLKTQEKEKQLFLL